MHIDLTIEIIFRLRNSLSDGKRRKGLDALQLFVVHDGERCEEYSEDSLDAEAKVRYEKKLQLVGPATCLYKLSSEAWIDNVTLWPPVESDIVLYLLQTPGKYTQVKLKTYKSLKPTTTL